MKRALVIGGFKGYHKRLKNFSYEVDVIKNKEKISADDYELYNTIIGINDIDEYSSEFVNDIVQYVKARKYNFIYNYSEKGQELTADICQKVGYPYHSISTVRKVNNKYLMREAVKNTVLDNVLYKVIKSKEDVFNLDKNIDWVFKPLNSWGSTNVFFYSLKTGKDYSNLLDSIEYPFLAEKMIYGDEYSVEAFVSNDNIKILSVTKKYTDPKTFVELGHTVRSTISKNIYAKLIEFLKILFSNLGITSGITHTEFKIFNGSLYLIETHIRMAGDNIADAISLATKVDIEDLIVKESISKRIPTLSLEDIRPISIWFATPKKNGRVDSIGFSSSDEKNILYKKVLINLGDIINGCHSSFDRTAVVIATGKTQHDSLMNAKKQISKLQVEIK